MKIDDNFFLTIDNVLAFADLDGEHCHLKHSKEDPAENHPAVDYLCQNFGNNDNIDFAVRIPICQECVEALLQDEWVLCYCINCNSSQWIHKKYSKLQWPFWIHIKWMDICPVCAEFGERIKDDHD